MSGKGSRRRPTTAPPRPRVYIAGPMTGYEHYNALAFEHAAAQWRGAGYEVETPFDANSVVWRKHHGRDFDPRRDVCDWGDPILAEMLAEDFATLCRADLVALLPGWHKSKGARAELLVALNLGKGIRDAATFAELSLESSLAFWAKGESALQEAQRLVHGDRGAAYGHPIDDYTRTGRMWGAVLDGWLRQQPGFADIPRVPDIDPRIACLLMAAVKISREVNAPKRDNRVDLAGYAECAQMVAERQAEAKACA